MPIFTDFPPEPVQTDLATFNTRMRNWIAHHATFVAEANTLAAEVIASGTFTNIVNTGGFSNNNATEDFDAITQTGFYRNTTTGCVGAPIAITNFLLFHQNIGVNAAAQMAIHAGGTGTYTRNKSAGVWSAWSDVADSSNIGRISAMVGAGAWGDRATLRHGTANTAIVFGTSYAGSALRYTGIGVQGAGVAILSTGSATAPSGTWQARCDFPAQVGVFGGGEFLRVL